MKQDLAAQMAALKRPHLLPRLNAVFKQLRKRFFKPVRIVVVTDCRKLKNSGKRDNSFKLQFAFLPHFLFQRKQFLAITVKNFPVQLRFLEILRPENLYSRLHLSSAERGAQLLMKPRLPACEIARQLDRYLLITVIYARKLKVQGAPRALKLSSAESCHAYIHFNNPFVTDRFIPRNAQAALLPKQPHLRSSALNQ